MKTDGAFRRFVGPLQIHVYLILTLPIFFTAFTFFVDVFTLHITPCSKNIASKSLNHTVDINISNITTRTDNHSDLTSVSRIAQYIAYLKPSTCIQWVTHCIYFAAGSHVSRGKSFCTWASDIYDGFTYRLFIRWRCIWQVGILPFLADAFATKEFKLITKSVFSPSNQVWKEITSHLLLSGPCSRYPGGGISAVCARVPDCPLHHWRSLLCHSHLHLQFRYCLLILY